MNLVLRVRGRIQGLFFLVVQKLAGDGIQVDGVFLQRSQLGVVVSQRGGEGRYVDGVVQWLVVGGVDYVAQRLFSVLDVVSFGVSVAQEYQFLLLFGLQVSYIFAVYLRVVIRKGQEVGIREGVGLGGWVIFILMIRKLRWRRLSMMILYLLEVLFRTWRSVSSEGVLLRMALRQVGSFSCEMISRFSLVAMVLYRVVGFLYLFGDVKWFYGQDVGVRVSGFCYQEGFYFLFVYFVQVYFFLFGEV